MLKYKGSHGKALNVLEDFCVHIPVMINEVIKYLSSPKVVVDCTLGLGGYAEKVLREFPTCAVFGIDQDA